jgi:Ca2+-binding EF-hand superfamily protein
VLLLSMNIVANAAHAEGPTSEKRVRAAEVAEMLWSLAKGADMGPNTGWFHPGESRYGWEWLSARFDADKDRKITRGEFRGSPEFFQRLDRNKDQSIAADDFDWSERSAFARQAMPANMWFRQNDRNSNGRISLEEWQDLFDRMSKGKGYVTADDLREAFPTQPPARPAGSRASEMPSRAVLLKGLLAGEIGSFHEGPRVGDPAPDFTLKTQDGSRQVQLAEFRGQKPVVLIFGSFT